MCPKCGSHRAVVLETRKIKGAITRRRLCHECKTRYTTTESPLKEHELEKMTLMQYIESHLQTWKRIKGVAE